MSSSVIYKKMTPDAFSKKMEISFYDEEDRKQTLLFEKVEWNIRGELKGLRYGENPGQEAALYKLINGNLALGGVSTIQPGKYLLSELELLLSGKHPGKINITDVDNALNILRYFHAQPCTVIVKHNNPCGVALGRTLADSYSRALMADRIAAFGGVVVLNRAVDKETAQLISQSYCEVVAAPEFSPGVLDLFSRKKNLRVMQITNMHRLHDFIGERYLDFKSLMDQGVIAQWSYNPLTLNKEDLSLAEAVYKGKRYRIEREPSTKEYEDMIFGWLVETGITSNSVIYVKDGVTIGIGTGEQDRVGVAEIARDKAYKKLADAIAWEKYGTPWYLMKDETEKTKIMETVREQRGGLKGSVMVSDGFFPFNDGPAVGIHQGVTAIIQPGGSIKDYETIELCNEHQVTMVFTQQRSFKH